MISNSQSFLPSVRSELIMIGCAYTITHSVVRFSKWTEAATLTGLICLIFNTDFIGCHVIDHLLKRFCNPRPRDEQLNRWITVVVFSLAPVSAWAVKRGLSDLQLSSPSYLEILGLYYLAARCLACIEILLSSLRTGC